MVHIQIQSLGFSKKEKYINADIISYLNDAREFMKNKQMKIIAYSV